MALRMNDMVTVELFRVTEKHVSNEGNELLISLISI